MEARATVSRTGISKFFVGAVLVLVALGLGIMAAFLAANLSGSAGATQHVNAAPGTVLRQDSPVDAAPAETPADIQIGPRHGGELTE